MAMASASAMALRHKIALHEKDTEKGEAKNKMKWIVESKRQLEDQWNIS